MACAPYPVAIPIRNVTLSNGIVAPGLEISIGTPPQPLALTVDPVLNNAFIYGTNGFCGNVTDSPSCRATRGGFYDPELSSSDSQWDNVVAAGGSKTDGDMDVPSKWASDSLILNDNTTLDNFPIAIAQFGIGGGYEGRSRLSMGENSTLLNTLKSSQRILSSTWSIFWGLHGANAPDQSEGIVVLGGYDSAKVQGSSSFTGSLVNTEVCATGATVSITGLDVRYPNGTRYSLFDGTGPSNEDALNACLDPISPSVMVMPRAYYERLMGSCNCGSETRSFGVDFFNFLYDKSEPTFEGDLVIGIQNALEITIPNSQLLIPEVTIGENGQRQANASFDELLINSNQEINLKDTPKLGRQFLSMAMLMMNHDAGTFTLWPAQPSTDQSLVAVGEQGESSKSFCAASSPTTTAENGNGKPDPKPEPKPVGAIAGGTVGGVAVLAGFILGAVFLRRRRRRGTARKTGYHGPSNDPQSPPSYSSEPHGGHEKTNAAVSQEPHAAPWRS
ncbi:aspartic-type endopeptidase like protein [Zymoseptoria brevis]|uniref:Aspartic-type endopeptidase like protein n=1 Tax=Zymoseptoria brevis TaxID=1047168 RepID=A0A0F4GG32_9PEZI|nr:aspartic-type endopeptidase like protein [Zymoseptoria brevis]